MASTSTFLHQHLSIRSHKVNTFLRSPPPPRDGRPPSLFKQSKLRALDIDFSDPGTVQAVIGGVVGIGMGLGIPIFLVSREERDEERVTKIRELNKATKEATGEYLSQGDIESMRPRRWTDRRDFQDDD